jgi:hypothetical protein
MKPVPTNRRMFGTELQNIPQESNLKMTFTRASVKQQARNP